jgi:hypothetical protein
MKKLLALSLALSTIAVASAEDKKFNISVKASALFPFDGDLRKAIGTGIPSFSFSPTADGELAGQRFEFDLGAFSRRDGGSKFFAAPLTYGLGIGLAPRGSKVMPYVKVGAGLAYMDYSLEVNGKKVSTKRGVPVGTLEAGIISGPWRVAAETLLGGSYDGFNFNGLQLSAAYRVLRF